MSSKSETGHAVNVANLATMISHCKGYGPDYQPCNPEITIIKLEDLHAASLTAIEKVNQFESVYKKITKGRKTAFNPLSKLATRIIKGFSACKASQEAINTARTAARKLKGGRASKKEKPDPENPREESNTISVSQMSFDNRINNLHRLIQTLKLEPKYIPNEADLKVTALETLYDNLNAHNEAARNATEQLDNARLQRDHLLYTAETGLLSIAADVKDYVYSVYGTTGGKFKQISAIPFRRFK